ncbi:hypothetical protein [Psychrobacter sanguinis]|uniref:hypothetical protein n=1 Tax=Psychrobacter sanguinis TaxID=861445 RepID=UPI002A7588DA|nr:hypothetical protein [Psychrobacter sanguinis]MDY3306756.1 hypothetical protein [Psychrobacter sanguinis]
MRSTSFRREADFLPNLNNDSKYPLFKNFADIENEYTFSATGVNVDYILTLSRNSNGYYITEKKSIDKLYENIFIRLKEISLDITFNDLNELISYVETTDLIQEASKLIKWSKADSFNYCITLSDRYMPRIYFDIQNQLNNTKDKQLLLDRVYKEKIQYIERNPKEYFDESQTLNDLNDSYQISKTEIKKELCNYLAVWIHAYRIMKAQNKANRFGSNQTILNSHRSQGWFKPSYKVNQDLTIELNTNFGYGSSGYFFILFIYRGIRIFPFVEWVNYKYAKVSTVEKYSIKLPSEQVNKERHDTHSSGLDKKSSIMLQEDWHVALEEIVEASNMSSKEFIDKYMSNALNELVNKLEDIIESDTNKLNKNYRKSDYSFSNSSLTGNSERVKLMDVKGSIISSTLDLIGHIVQLEDFVNTNTHIKNIESLNLKILPILKETIPDCHTIKSDLEAEIIAFTEQLRVIWQDKGLRELNKAYKLNSITQNQEKDFIKLKKEHDDLSLQKKDLEGDLKNSNELLNSIKRYVYSIEKYFDKTR